MLNAANGNCLWHKVSLAHNVSFWAQKLHHLQFSDYFWAQPKILQIGEFYGPNTYYLLLESLFLKRK